MCEPPQVARKRQMVRFPKNRSTGASARHREQSAFPAICRRKRASCPSSGPAELERCIRTRSLRNKLSGQECPMLRLPVNGHEPVSAVCLTPLRGPGTLGKL